MAPVRNVQNIQKCLSIKKNVRKLNVTALKNTSLRKESASNAVSINSQNSPTAENAVCIVPHKRESLSMVLVENAKTIKDLLMTNKCVRRPGVMITPNWKLMDLAPSVQMAKFRMKLIKRGAPQKTMNLTAY